MTLGELLAQYDITEADLSTSLERRLSAQPDPAAADLTSAEEDFWTRHAGIPLGDAAGLPAGPRDRRDHVGHRRGLAVADHRAGRRLAGRPPVAGVAPAARPPALLVPHRVAATAAALAVHRRRARLSRGWRRCSPRCPPTCTPRRSRGSSRLPTPTSTTRARRSGWRPAETRSASSTRPRASSCGDPPRVGLGAARGEAAAHARAAPGPTTWRPAPHTEVRSAVARPRDRRPARHPVEPAAPLRSDDVAVRPAAAPARVVGARGDVCGHGRRHLPRRGVRRLPGRRRVAPARALPDRLAARPASSPCWTSPRPGRSATAPRTCSRPGRSRYAARGLARSTPSGPTSTGSGASRR